MDILDHLEAIPDDWNEESLSLDFEIHCLGLLIAAAAKSGNASNTTRSLDCQTLCRKVNKAFAGLNSTTEINEKIFGGFVECLETELPAVDLSGLLEHLTEGNHIPADQDQLNNIRLSRRLLWAMTHQGDVRAAIGYATSTQKVVRNLQSDAAKERRYLTTCQARNLIERTIAKASDWLTENTTLDPDTELADAVSNACRQLNQLMRKEKQHDTKSN